MNRRTAALGGLALVNLAATVAFQLYLVARLGLGGETDAYFASATVPQLVIATVVGSAVNVVVPLFAGRTSCREVSEDAWSILIWTAVALAAFTICILLSARPMTSFLLPGLNANDQAAAAELTQIAAFGLPFAGLALVMTAIHQGLDRYISGAMIGAATSVGLLIATVVALPRGGLVAVAWLGIVRSLVQTLCLLPGLGRPSIQFDRPAVRSLWADMRPLMASASYFKMAPLLDRWFASFGVSGDISLLHLFQQIFAGVATLFGKSIVEPFIGVIARSRKLDGLRESRLSTYLKYYKVTSFVAGAIYLFGIVLIGAFSHAFLPAAVSNRILPFYLAFGGLYTAGFLGQLAAAWFYAEGDTRIPAKVGTIGFSIGIVARLALFQPLGALSVAIGVSATQILNWLMLHRHIIRRQNS